MSAKMNIPVAVCPPRSSKFICFISPDLLKQNEPKNEPKHEPKNEHLCGGVPATFVEIHVFISPDLFKQTEPKHEPKNEIPRGGVPATVVKIMCFHFTRLV